jgi:hypothetical protein
MEKNLDSRVRGNDDQKLASKAYEPLVKKFLLSRYRLSQPMRFDE